MALVAVKNEQRPKAHRIRLQDKMNMHNPNLHHEHHNRLEAVEARLAWHKKILGIAILLVICMAAVTLALLAVRIP